jgi:hypothetical protein
MKRSAMNVVVAGVIALGLTLPAVAQTYNGHQLQGRVTYVPSGQALDAVLTSPIDTSVAKAGDIFNAKLYSPVYVGNELVLPANTQLEGQITSAEHAGHAGTNGTLNMRLTAAITPDGQRFPLSAIISTSDKQTGIVEDKQGNIKGRSTKATIGSGVARTAAWTAGGTLLGIIFEPIVAGSVGAGAIAGVATGGAVGLGSNLWRKGKNVQLASGTRVQFSLDQPMSLSPGLASVAQPYR